MKTNHQHTFAPKVYQATWSVPISHNFSINRSPPKRLILEPWQSTKYPYFHFSYNSLGVNCGFVNCPTPMENLDRCRAPNGRLMPGRAGRLMPFITSSLMRLVSVPRLWTPQVVHQLRWENVHGTSAKMTEGMSENWETPVKWRVFHVIRMIHDDTQLISKCSPSSDLNQRYPWHKLKA